MLYPCTIFSYPSAFLAAAISDAASTTRRSAPARPSRTAASSSSASALSDALAQKITQLAAPAPPSAPSGQTHTRAKWRRSLATSAPTRPPDGTIPWGEESTAPNAPPPFAGRRARLRARPLVSDSGCGAPARGCAHLARSRLSATMPPLPQSARSAARLSSVSREAPGAANCTSEDGAETSTKIGEYTLRCCAFSTRSRSSSSLAQPMCTKTPPPKAGEMSEA
mmetsp:Transcript_12613/g.29602  ORF Transcript_12613/g.29602 Transcript_12613/m.29602 type:complete len:224 (-) Transcript_12613:289-960(-)